MKHKHQSGSIVGALAAGVAMSCAACSTLPEGAFEPDEKLRQEIGAEIEEGRRNLEIVEMMIEAAGPLPNSKGEADADNSDVTQEVREAHDRLVDIYQDGRVMVMWVGDYEENPSSRGIYVYGDPGIGDDQIVAFLNDETGELMTHSSHFEHEGIHSFGSSTHHSDEVEDAQEQDLTPAERTKLYLEQGDLAYTDFELFDLPRVLEMYMELMEVNMIRDYYEAASDEFVLENGQEIYIELSELKEVSREEWVQKAATWFYFHENPDTSGECYTSETNPWSRGRAAALGISEDEMHSILIKSDMYERRQDYINEVMQEVILDYGEEVRESNEIDFRENEMRGSRL